MNLRRCTKKAVGLALCVMFILLAVVIPVQAGHIHYEYDELGRLTSVTYGNGVSSTYTYDSGGNLLQSTNINGLELISTDPENNSVGVSVYQDINMVFETPIVIGDEFDSIRILDESDTVVENVYRSINLDTLTLDPYYALEYYQTYRVIVPADSVVSEVYDVALLEDYEFSFTTEEMTGAPHIINTVPADGSEGVSADTDIVITLSGWCSQGSTFSDIELLDENNDPVNTMNMLVLDELTIMPVFDLGSNMTYTVIIPAGAVNDLITDVPLASDYAFSFTTEEAASGPQIVSTVPEDGSTGVAVNGNIQVTFSATCIQGSQFSSIVLLNENNNSVAAIKLVAGNKLTIDPLFNLQSGKTYRVIIPAGSVKDMFTGEPLAEGYEFSFTT